jgi:hypothetical protein
VPGVYIKGRRGAHDPERDRIASRTAQPGRRRSPAPPCSPPPSPPGGHLPRRARLRWRPEVHRRPAAGPAPPPRSSQRRAILAERRGLIAVRCAADGRQRDDPPVRSDKSRVRTGRVARPAPAPCRPGSTAPGAFGCPARGTGRRSGMAAARSEHPACQRRSYANRSLIPAPSRLFHTGGCGHGLSASDEAEPGRVP